RFGFMKHSPQKISKVDWVTGGCMMVSKKIFEKIGGFDKNIFMYMEDMELCFRAKKEGFATYFFPATQVLHSSQGSSNRTFAIVHIYQGILYFYRKYMPQWEVFLVQCLLRLKASLLVSIGRLTGNSYLRITYEKALASI
ncbi:MAG: glycosyltransferase family 2 protein, partial [Patescibacteria group bacterium]|nr:glycosyltransferase family 2 protein [Patescibacteria group bacterium]